MKEDQKRSMTIHFNDGSKRLLGFPAPVPDSDANLAARPLVLEAEGALVVIPIESIQYRQCFPAPKKLPAYSIKGARLKD